MKKIYYILWVLLMIFIGISIVEGLEHVYQVGYEKGKLRCQVEIAYD